MKIYSKKLSEITPQERRRLNYLTLRGSDSLMRSEVLQRKQKLAAITLFIAICDKKIVGWSAIISGKIYTYVMRAYRKQGIGKELLTQSSDFLQKKNKKPKVIAWDQNSLEFFASCQYSQKLLLEVEHV